MRIPVGQKHVQILTSFIPSAATFGGAAGLGLLYFTDWKLILQYLPYYNGKFENKSE